MISKHGSDGIHGQVYYKRGSSAFNAKSYFDTSKSSYKLSEAEGELGGAIVPHWTYFYGGGMYQKTPYSETLFADVPTAQMRTLDFSQFLNAADRPQRKGSGRPGSQETARLSQQCNPFQPRCPGVFALPDQLLPGAQCGHRQHLHPELHLGPSLRLRCYVGNWPFGRIDQRLSANSQVFFHWMQNQTASIAPGSVGEQLNATQTVRYRGYVISGVTALSSSLVNQISVGHTAVLLAQGESESKFDPLQGRFGGLQLGLIGVNPNAFRHGVSHGFHQRCHRPFHAIMAAATPRTAGNDSINTVQDSLIWSHGRHSVKFGGQYQSYHWLEGAVPQNVYGDFTFTGAFTGLGFADFPARPAVHQHPPGRQSGPHPSPVPVRPLSERLLPGHLAADPGLRSALGLLHHPGL
jgi:hypothetical protein